MKFKKLRPISRIVRKQRHHKFVRDSKVIAKYEGVYPTSNFSKPNYQELLTSLRVVVQLDSSEESAPVKLTRIAIALSTPEQITRFGGLSLGESWALVNGVRTYREDGGIRWLVKDCRGLISLPVWIDRQNQRGTFQRFSVGDFNSDCWVEIKSPKAIEITQLGKPKRGRRLC